MSDIEPIVSRYSDPIIASYAWGRCVVLVPLGWIS